MFSKSTNIKNNTRKHTGHKINKHCLRFFMFAFLAFFAAKYIRVYLCSSVDTKNGLSKGT
jgi:hypothetical protein